MSRKAIENTIRAMRDRTAVAYLRRGILGNVSLNAGRRAEDICEMFAGRVEADVADIIAENERLKSDIAELLECLKKVYDEECTDFGTGDVFNRITENMNGGAK